MDGNQLGTSTILSSIVIDAINISDMRRNSIKDMIGSILCES